MITDAFQCFKYIYICTFKGCLWFNIYIYQSVYRCNIQFLPMSVLVIRNSVFIPIAPFFNVSDLVFIGIFGEFLPMIP